MGSSSLMGGGGGLSVGSGRDGRPKGESGSEIDDVGDSRIGGGDGKEISVLSCEAKLSFSASFNLKFTSQY